MKRFLAGLLIFLLVAAVAGYFLYPTVSAQLCQRRDAGILAAYKEKAAAMDTEKKDELFAEAKAYNETLEGVHVEDVFTGGTPRTNRDYLNRLNIHSGIIGELIISKIGVSLPVYHQSTETPATRNLVHLDGSSLPADSTGENIVLAGPGVLQAEGVLGQINLTDDRMLEDLDKLIPGDMMILNVLDRTMVYRVSEIHLLSSAGLKELDLTPEEEQERLTVITRSSERRLLVQADRIPIQEARTMLAEEDKVTFAENWQNVLFLGSPVMLAGIFLLWVIERIRKHSYHIPGEGRQSKKREQKAKAQIAKIETETSEGEGKK